MGFYYYELDTYYLVMGEYKFFLTENGLLILDL